MAPKTPSKTTQTTEVKLPAWVDAASQANYAEANTIGNTPTPIFQGNRVGTMQGDTQAAINGLKTQTSQPMFDQAAGIFGKLGAGDVPTLANTDLSKYMNPYTDEVVNKTLADSNKQRETALLGNSASANAAGAFGGSRHGVADAVTNSESLQNQGLLAAQLRSQGFNNAQSAAQGDITNQIGAMGAGASGLSSTGSASSDARSKMLAGLLGTGQQEQALSQQQIDSEMAKLQEPRTNQIDNLNLRLSALGMSPYGKTDTSTKVSSAGSSGTDIGQMGMGIFSLLLGLSEDDTKTDKEKVGKVPGTDLDLWAYRYKKDPKTYPKVVGVMASDVEKKMPEAVHKVDGKRIINYGLIGEAMNG